MNAASERTRKASLPLEVEVLGSGEKEVAKIVYMLKSATAKEVLECLPKKIQNATVRTTMNRLVAKGILRRVLSGSTYVYVPAITKRDSAMMALVEFADVHFDGSIIRAAKEMARLMERP